MNKNQKEIKLTVQVLSVPPTVLDPWMITPSSVSYSVTPEGQGCVEANPAQVSQYLVNAGHKY